MRTRICISHFGALLGMVALASSNALAVGSTPVTVVNPVTSPIPVVGVGSSGPIVPVMAHINFSGSSFSVYTVPANKTLVLTSISYTFVGYSQSDIPAWLEMYTNGPPSTPIMFLPISGGTLTRANTYASYGQLGLNIYVPAGTNINIITDCCAVTRLVMINGYLVGN